MIGHGATGPARSLVAGAIARSIADTAAAASPNPSASPGVRVPVWEQDEHGDQSIAGWERA